MRELVAVVAGPVGWNDTRESWLARAARRAGVSYRQVKALFYGEITDPQHRSARLVRDAAAQLAAERAGRAEASALVELLLARRNALAAKDADFHREDIAALERALGRMGCDYSTVAVRRGEGGNDLPRHRPHRERR